ncbi:hypothetical protein DDI_3302 [Dickeya dianthicola RNS04.9]|nr:hypothetical protein DDI_3302 [Dickeya dianthicola RNS04.9]
MAFKPLTLPGYIIHVNLFLIKNNLPFLSLRHYLTSLNHPPCRSLYFQKTFFVISVNETFLL